jgi:hypothetical protein
MYCRFWMLLVLGMSACQLYEGGPWAASRTDAGTGLWENPSTVDPEVCTANPDGQISGCPEV